jgi:hypothetical protein
MYRVSQSYGRSPRNYSSPSALQLKQTPHCDSKNVVNVQVSKFEVVLFLDLKG